jgi:hypothetical protein
MKDTSIGYQETFLRYTALNVYQFSLLTVLEVIPFSPPASLTAPLAYAGRVHHIMVDHARETLMRETQ